MKLNCVNFFESLDFLAALLPSECFYLGNGVNMTRFIQLLLNAMK